MSTYSKVFTHNHKGATDKYTHLSYFDEVRKSNEAALCDLKQLFLHNF